MANNILEIYTDGACLENPGPGGWGAILVYNGVERTCCGWEKHTTNNRMELTAVIQALKLVVRPVNIVITSDSKYVVDAINKGWLQSWIKGNKLDTKKNPDLWREYIEVSKAHKIKFRWVKGHAGHPYNERCDEMATKMAREIERQLNSGWAER